ncbi:MAG: hypothetical protein ABH869_08490 [Candidatus Omnitrophota bacterium]
MKKYFIVLRTIAVILFFIVPVSELCAEEKSGYVLSGPKRDGAFLSPGKYGREDPFDPVFEIQDRKESLILSGIVWHTETPKAIINKQLLAIGDEIDGYIIVGINQEVVILNDGTKNFELRLWRGNN